MTDANTPELCAMALRLSAESGEPVPANMGHHAHAALLHLVHSHDPELSQWLHDSGGLKPFTLSFLSGTRSSAGFLLRVTSLDPKLTEVLSHAFQGPGQPIISLGAAHFSVSPAGVEHQVLSWTGRDTWGRLVTDQPAARKVTLQFASPTCFSFGRRKILLPEPDLVFGGLLKRWNSLAPFPLPHDLLDLFAEQLAISEFHNLNTRMLDFARYKEKGFTGAVTFEALGSWQNEELCALNTLADFAFYAGVGYHTTMGLGQVRRMVRT